MNMTFQGGVTICKKAAGLSALNQHDDQNTGAELIHQQNPYQASVNSN